MNEEYKLKLSISNQFKNLAALLIISIVYYGLIIFINEDILRLWYSHLLTIIFLIPTLCIHISYLLENFGDEYILRKNSIVDLKRNIEYDQSAILKIEIHKYGNLPNGNHFLPFHNYQFCRVKLKDGNSFIISSLLKFNIDEFLKEKMAGIVFERHFNYFPIA